MAKYNQEWGKCVEELLERHDMSLREAEVKLEGKVSRSYISEIKAGKLPSAEIARSFLKIFPREEAIQCMKTGGYPVPPEWITDPFESIEICLRNTGWSDETQAEILESAREIVKAREKM